MSKNKKSAYAEAGVNIDSMMTSLKKIKKNVKNTNTLNVLSEIGSFGEIIIIYPIPILKTRYISSISIFPLW